MFALPFCVLFFSKWGFPKKNFYCICVFVVGMFMRTIFPVYFFSSAQHRMKTLSPKFWAPVSFCLFYLFLKVRYLFYACFFCFVWMNLVHLHYSFLFLSIMIRWSRKFRKTSLIECSNCFFLLQFIFLQNMSTLLVISRFPHSLTLSVTSRYCSCCCLVLFSTCLLINTYDNTTKKRNSRLLWLFVLLILF